MNTGFIIAMIGIPEIILIAVIVLLIFGGKKIPELMRGLGKGMKEFKEAQKDDDTKPSDTETEKKQV